MRVARCVGLRRRDQRHRQEHDGGATQGERIGGRHFKQQGSEEMRDRQSDHDAGGYAGSRQKQRLSEHALPETPRSRAEGSADAQLARPLPHRGRDHAVEAQGR